MMMFHAFRGHGHPRRGQPGHEHARHRRPLLRRVRDAPTASTCRSGRSSRSSTPSCSGYTGLEGEDLPYQMDKTQWGPMKERLAEHLQVEDPRRVVRDHGGHRRVLRPGAAHERGGQAPAQRRPRAPSSSSTASCSRRRRRGSAPTPGAVQRPPSHAGQHTDEVLAEWLGLDADARRQAPRRRRRRLAPRRSGRVAPLGCRCARRCCLSLTACGDDDDR